MNHRTTEPQNHKTTKPQNHSDESEISLNDIVDFFLQYRRFLLIGAIVGFLISVGTTFRFGNYEAVATLVNNGGISYLTWNRLKKDLPILAHGLSQRDDNKNSYLNELSGELWWQKNAVPTFAYSKNDSKEVVSVTKELQDAEATNIKNIVVKATGSTKEIALVNLATATTFIRSGAAYLALKDIVTDYQIELLNSEPEIEKSILALEIELQFLNRRVAGLELLRSKFPGGSNIINSQVVDLKDASAKYLPISTQLIAANQDITALKESLTRLYDRKKQITIISRFLPQAHAVITKNFDGPLAITEVAQIESSLRKNIKPSDLNALQRLNSIKYGLAVIHTRFSLGIEQPTFISTSDPKYMKNALIGLFGGFFLALLCSFFAAIWLRYRTSAADFSAVISSSP
jgi:hypothetical protein